MGGACRTILGQAAGTRVQEVTLERGATPFIYFHRFPRLKDNLLPPYKDLKVSIERPVESARESYILFPIVFFMRLLLSSLMYRHLLLLLLASSSFAWRAREFLSARVRHGGKLSKIYEQEGHLSEEHCQAHTYTAPLDHFSNSSIRSTFEVRFWVDDSCARSDDAPLFVQMGGEAAARCVPCDELAKKHGAVSVAIEHRFYGTSVPAGGLTSANLPFLTTDQNLEDTKAIIDLLNPEKARRVLTFGGSYSGGTASWFRTHYPETTFASISSSGVVNAIIDYTEFDKSITATLKDYDAYPACFETLLHAFDDIDYLAENELEDLKSKPFNASNLVRTPHGDSDFLYMVADAVAMAVQYGHKQELCKAMEVAGSPIDKVASFIEEFYGPTFQGQAFYDTEKIAALTEESTEGVGAKSWRWQKCSQVAYLQSRPESTRMALRSRHLTQEALHLQCVAMFANSSLDLEKTNAIFQKKYGAARPDRVGATRIFYLDYSDDPWKTASVQGPFTPASLDLHYCYTKCDGCGHCGAGVPANEKRCDDASDAAIAKWLAM